MTDAAFERATILKVARRLMPFLLLLYFVSWLDRANLTFASKTMRADLGIGDAAYGFGAGIFYIGYALFEIPSNLILARVGARIWIARIMISWGLISAGMIFVEGTNSFYVMRFLLGVAEAGFFPGIVYYLTQWFPAPASARAVSYFMIGIPLSLALGAPISGGLLQLDGVGGLHGWQWMFLVEGLPAVALGFVVLAWLTEKPADARWLSAEQRDWLTAHIRAEHERAAQRHGVTLRSVLTHPVVWILALVQFACQTSSYGLTYWVTQVLEKTTTLSHISVVFLTAVPYAHTAVGMVLIGRSADRTGKHIMHVAVPLAIGALALIATGHITAFVPALIAVTIAAIGDYGTRGPFWALPRKFLAGEASAVGIGFINSCAAVGGFVGPWSMGLLSKATGGLTAGMWLLAIILLSGVVLTLSLRSRAELASTN